MKLLLIHPDLDTLRSLVQAIAGTGDFTLNIASSEAQAQSALREEYDLALLWLDLFAVKGGLARLQAFLRQIEDVQAVLVVPPNVHGLAEKLGALPVRDTWLLPDVRPETVRSKLAAFVRQNPPSHPEQRDAPEMSSGTTMQDQADLPDQPDGDLGDDGVRTSSSIGPRADGVRRPSDTNGGSDAIGRDPADWNSRSGPDAIHQTGISPSPRLAPVIDRPSQATDGVASTPQRTGASINGRSRPSAGKRWIGVWSASGGAGVTTVASALARLSGRPLVGLSEPGVSLALGVPPTTPWKTLQAHSLTVILGPSLYGVSPDEALAAAQTHLPRLGSDLILDLPSGASAFTLSLVASLHGLLYVLPADRAAVALAVHALAELKCQNVQIVWNRASAAETREAAASLRYLDRSPAIAGQLDNVLGVNEARRRNQTVPDAAEDGVSLGNLPQQLRALAAALYPDLAPPPSVGGNGDGANRNRFLPKLEIIDDKSFRR